MARILFVVNHAGFFLSHRLPIALAAQAAGYDVTIATPRSKHVPRIESAGLPWTEIQLSRSGRNPFLELRTIASLAAVYRRLKPDLVHHVSPKPVLYGTPVARILGVRGVVDAVSGMGHAFSEDHSALFQKGVALGYRMALRHPNMRVIFQNVEQKQLFVESGWARADQAVLIPGSGVDTNVYAPSPKSEGYRPVTVILVSRMIYTKGIVQFVLAAKALQDQGALARFVLVGEPDPDNLASIPEAELREWAETEAVEYLGRREDMPAIYADADIACLPTFYPEGIPKALIEAASCGLPIVTTDWPGCREIVRDRVNGLLVPIKDVDALVEALRTLIADPQLREEMGKRGREMVVANFSLSSVIEKTLALYRELLA